ncbi:hypothetical protein FJY63_04825, partial [Candidatus Sumerlaeota bacterium]|nr:hypothetical protein [Candidatus Sumerlaeota bacterium]
EVPAVLRWEKSRQKRKSTFRAGRLIVSHLMFGFNEYPLMLFGTIAAILVLIGIVIGFYLLHMSLSGHPVAGRPAVFFSVLAILAGILILLFCFMSFQIRDLRRIVYRVQRDVRSRDRSNTDAEEKK